VVYVLVRHKVEDYEKWKSGFEDALEFRKSKGKMKEAGVSDEPDIYFLDEATKSNQIV
jgi:hypothetical protein